MSKNDKTPWYGKCIITILLLILIILVYHRGVKDGYYKRGQELDNISPVEKSKIDTLYIKRDSLIYNVKYLDSIKYDTIQKVYKFDDTTSVKFFYMLVSE